MDETNIEKIYDDDDDDMIKEEKYDLQKRHDDARKDGDTAELMIMMKSLTKRNQHFL